MDKIKKKGDSEIQKFYADGESFFADLLEHIKSATSSIDLEYYIFDWDDLGRQVVQALCDKARSGVKVRICVDGVGAYRWTNEPIEVLTTAGIQQKMYHPVPWVFSKVFPTKSSDSLINRFWNLNRRNHKKVCIIDRKLAYVGSMNITKNSLIWKESAIRVDGERVSVLENSFIETWRQATPVGCIPAIPEKKQKRISTKALKSPKLRLNQRLGLRLENYRSLIKSIKQARKRVWVTNAYFVPPPKLLEALCKAACRGADVKILLPGLSDVKIVRWVSRFYFRRLIQAGVQIFEYDGTVLHAKTAIIDRCGVIGTSNYNHRSFYHDLEVDVLISNKTCVQKMENEFFQNIKSSIMVKEENLKRRPFVELILGRLFLLFRSWL